VDAHRLYISVHTSSNRGKIIQERSVDNYPQRIYRRKSVNIIYKYIVRRNSSNSRVGWDISEKRREEEEQSCTSHHFKGFCLRPPFLELEDFLPQRDLLELSPPDNRNPAERTRVRRPDIAAPGSTSGGFRRSHQRRNIRNLPPCFSLSHAKPQEELEIVGLWPYEDDDEAHREVSVFVLSEKKIIFGAFIHGGGGRSSHFILVLVDVCRIMFRAGFSSKFSCTMHNPYTHRPSSRYVTWYMLSLHVMWLNVRVGESSHFWRIVIHFEAVCEVFPWTAFFTSTNALRYSKLHLFSVKSLKII
jgi:hypothetical protein